MATRSIPANGGMTLLTPLLHVLSCPSQRDAWNISNTRAARLDPASLRPTSYQLPPQGRQQEPGLNLLKPPKLIRNLTDYLQLAPNSPILSSTCAALMWLQASCHSGGDGCSSALHTLSNTFHLEMNQPVHRLLETVSWSRPASGSQLGHLCSWPFRRSCKIC